jgi:hypothetical protein
MPQNRGDRIPDLPLQNIGPHPSAIGTATFYVVLRAAAIVVVIVGWGSRTGRSKHVPALGAAYDVTRKLPETPAVLRGGLVLAYPSPRGVDKCRGYSPVRHRDPDPLLARLVDGLVLPLVVAGGLWRGSFGFEPPPVKPPDSVPLFGVQPYRHLARHAILQLFERAGPIDVVEDHLPELWHIPTLAGRSVWVRAFKPLDDGIGRCTLLADHLEGPSHQRHLLLVDQVAVPLLVVAEAVVGGGTGYDLPAPGLLELLREGPLGYLGVLVLGEVVLYRPHQLFLDRILVFVFKGSQRAAVLSELFLQNEDVAALARYPVAFCRED